MQHPAIRTTVVGSYPVPSWLRTLPSEPNLHDAILVVLKTQELAGLDVVSDGELSRFDVDHPETNGMIESFVLPLAGVSRDLTREEREAFRARGGFSFRSRPAGVVRGRIGEGTLDLPAAWERVRGLTTRPLKFTVTSPYMLARTLLDRHYGSVEAVAMDIAGVLRVQLEAIDASVIQVDEANIPGSPADGPWAARAVNEVLSGAKGERAVHLCFGNYGGQTVQAGEYRALLPFLDALECDHLVLEVARRNPEEIEVLKDLRPSLGVGIGAIDIKDNQVERPDDVARAIERAVAILGADRVRWVHPDCGLWMLPRTVADAKMRALVEGRDLFLARRE